MLSKDRKEELEQEARIALLSHYSSKSNNQVTNILTIALSFFALVTAIEPLRTFFGEGSIPNVPSAILCDIFIALIVAVLIAFGIHSFVRLRFYGESASFVLFCEMASPKRTKEYWAGHEKAEKYDEKKVLAKMKKLHYSGDVSLEAISMYMRRLNVGCADLYHAKYLMKNEEPFEFKKLTFWYVRWRESAIVAGLALTFMIVFIAVINVL